MTLENYKRARKFTKVAMFGNLLLVGLVLLQVFSSVVLKDIPFLVLVIVFGIFVYILNVKSIALHNQAIKEIENNLSSKESLQSKDKEIIQP